MQIAQKREFLDANTFIQINQYNTDKQNLEKQN